MESKNFTDPISRTSGFVRWFAVTTIALLSIAFIGTSISRGGLGRNWRISAGVSGLVLLASNVLRLFSNRHRRRVVLPIMATVGAVAFWLAFWESIDEWWEDFLLEMGLGLILLVGFDQLVDTMVERASRDEKDQGRWFDGLAVGTAVRHRLSITQYQAFRYGLDLLSTEKQAHGYLDRAEVLLDVAEKAANMPDHLDVAKNTEFIAQLAHDEAVIRASNLAARGHKLSDIEYLYLTGSLQAKEVVQGQSPDDATLNLLAQNMAELIVRRRRKWLGRIWYNVLVNDPLQTAGLRRQLDQMYGTSSDYPPMTLDRLDDRYDND